MNSQGYEQHDRGAFGPLAADCVIVTGHVPWTDEVQTPHCIAAHFARRTTVIYVEPPPVWHPLAGDFSHRRIARAPGTLLRQVHDRIWVYSPYALPGARFAAVASLNSRLLQAGLERILRRLGLRRPLLWLAETRNSTTIQSGFSNCPSVFHALDPFRHPADIRAAATLARRARCVLAVSAGAAAGLTQYNSTIIFPNGWNFSRAALSAAPARELTSIPQPRIVVISYLTSLLDYQLLGRIATEVTASLVILGRRHGKLSSNDERCFGALAQLKNVYLLGGRPTTELPSYIIGADVCLAPYKLSDRNYEIDPLKVYQYLALGKPVVSRPVKALEAIEDLVVCASDEDSFVQAVRAALDAPCTLSAKERRRSFASATTWDRRWSNLADALGDDPEMQQFVRRYVGTPNRDGG